MPDVSWRHGLPKKSARMWPGGKMIYFNREEIDEWALSQRVATADEIRSEARRRIRKSQL